MSPNTPASITLKFARTEGLSVTTTAEMQITLSQKSAQYVYHGEGDMGPDSRAIHLLSNALSKWIEETPEGREAWEISCGDLNVGDIACYQYDTEESLKPYLDSQGISIHRVEVSGRENALCFDTVLASPDID